MQQLLLKSYLSPGDALVMTCAVRDLHRAFPNRFLTDVRTTAAQLWENNPYVTPLDENAPDVRVIDMQYPLINKCNTSPFHFIQGYVQFLERELSLQIPVTEFKGDIHLAHIEKQWMSQVEEFGFKGWRPAGAHEMGIRRGPAGGFCRELVLVKRAPFCEKCCFVVSTNTPHGKGRP